MERCDGKPQASRCHSSNWT